MFLSKYSEKFCCCLGRFVVVVVVFICLFVCRPGLTVLPRLLSSSWAQVILLPQPPEQLDYRDNHTMPSSEHVRGRLG
jgi:hypothetical protein